MSADVIVGLGSLATAAAAVSGLVKAILPLVEDIRFITKKNVETKRKLATSLSELQENIKKAGNLAKVGENYTRNLVSLLKLQCLCERAIEFASDHHEELVDQRSSRYDQNWHHLRDVRGEISNGMEVPKKEIMSRVEWYGEKDPQQIPTKLQDVIRHYDRATKELENTTPDMTALLTDLKEMQHHLDLVTKGLEDTLYNEVLGNLQKLDR